MSGSLQKKFASINHGKQRVNNVFWHFIYSPMRSKAAYSDSERQNESEKIAFNLKTVIE